jgi:uncharacterized membrane protein
MDVSTFLLGFGLALTGLGVLMLLLGMRHREGGGEVEGGAAGLIFIGPVPLVFGGRGRWMLFWIAAVFIFVILIVLAMAQPGPVG